jgi:polar amino acid transport system substrate-binding protein
MLKSTYILNPVLRRLCAYSLIYLFSFSLLSISNANQLRSDSLPQTTILIISEGITANNLVAPIPELTAKIIQYFENKLNLKFEVRRYPWKRALDNAIKGEGLIYGASKTKERALSLSFSEALFEDHAWLITRCDASFPFNKLTDLKGKIIGMVRGASAGDEFDQQANILFKVEDDLEATPLRFLKLFNRRMDAFVFFQSNTDSATLAKSLNRQYGKNLPGFDRETNPAFCVLPHALSTISIHFAIARDQDQSVLKKIDRAIIKGRRNGELGRALFEESQKKE